MILKLNNFTALVVLFISSALHAINFDFVTGHDPCAIKSGEKYYMFMTGSGIKIRQSDDLVDWDGVGRVFPDKAPAWTYEAVPGFKGHIWAPDIALLNGKYYLYYSVSTFGSNRSAIGLAVNSTLDPDSEDYKWEDRGMVIQSIPRTNSWNAIDANLAFDEKGEPWLSFGSYWSGVVIGKVDPSTGKYAGDKPKLKHIAMRPGVAAIEAPFIVNRMGYYYLFVSFDKCCKGVDSTYKIMVGRSEKIDGPYVDRSGNPMLKGGGTLVLASHGYCRGPGHNAILQDGERQWLVHHMYDSRKAGIPSIQVRPLIWAKDAWPLTGEPVAGKSLVNVPEDDELQGVWKYSVNYGDDIEIELLGRSKFKGDGVDGLWLRRGNMLFFKFHGIGGAEVRKVECYLAPDGKSFVGRDDEDWIIRGIIETK